MESNRPPLPTKADLEALVRKIASGLEEQARPFIIEFAGTPKAGKTTCVDAISKFLDRNHVPVHLITERASVCPISDKNHLYFNTWTGLTSLTQMLESVERQFNIVILDRGVFDTLVWLDFLKNREALSGEEFDAFEKFLTLDRWMGMIDIVVALVAEPEEALRREYQNQLTDKGGTVMNEASLNNYNASLDTAQQKYVSEFRKIIKIDTTILRPLDGVTQIAHELLTACDLLIDEEIAVVPRKLVNEYLPDEGVLLNAKAMAEFLDNLRGSCAWIRRTAAEDDPTVVQLIPAAVVYRGQEVLVCNIRGERQGSLVNRTSIWVGGHVRRSDEHDAQAHKTRTMLHSCLRRELTEELRIRVGLENLPRLPRALVWDNTSTKSLKHLGIVFEYKLPDTMPREVLHYREHYERPDKSLFTFFSPIGASLARQKKWESWSVKYLSHVHSVVFSRKSAAQAALF